MLGGALLRGVAGSRRRGVLPALLDGMPPPQRYLAGQVSLAIARLTTARACAGRGERVGVQEHVVALVAHGYPAEITAWVFGLLDCLQRWQELAGAPRSMSTVTRNSSCTLPV